MYSVQHKRHKLNRKKGIKCHKPQVKNNKNNTRIFSAQNRQKNKNIQPGPEKQHSYKKKECTILTDEHSNLKDFAVPL